MIGMPDLLENTYTREDFDDHTYVGLLNLFEGLAHHLALIENPFIRENFMLVRNFSVVRELLLEKLSEPGW